jgi:large repetitive protein
MRHRAPRRLFTVLDPRRLLRARPRLARLTARPTLRLAGGLAVMLLLATGAVVTAETLRDGIGAAATSQPTSEGRLPGGPRTSRANERAPLPPTPSGPGARPAEDGAPQHREAPSPEPASTPSPAPESTSLLPTTPSARLSAGVPSPLSTSSLGLPSATTSPTTSPSSSGEQSTEDSGGESGDGDDSGDGGTQQRQGDQNPPQTTLLSGPPLRHVASFVFESDESGTFECSLDGQAFRTCDSPRLYTDLGGGWHTFKVRAIDDAGNADPTPAVRRWHSSAHKGRSVPTEGLSPSG